MLRTESLNITHLKKTNTSSRRECKKVKQNIIHNRRKTAKLNACYFHLIRQQSVSLKTFV